MIHFLDTKSAEICPFSQLLERGKQFIFFDIFTAMFFQSIFCTKGKLCKLFLWGKDALLKFSLCWWKWFERVHWKNALRKCSCENVKENELFFPLQELARRISFCRLFESRKWIHFCVTLQLIFPYHFCLRNIEWLVLCGQVGVDLFRFSFVISYLIPSLRLEISFCTVLPVLL